jgi:hypothetical protein
MLTIGTIYCMTVGSSRVVRTDAYGAAGTDAHTTVVTGGRGNNRSTFSFGVGSHGQRSHLRFGLSVGYVAEVVCRLAARRTAQ